MRPSEIIIALDCVGAAEAFALNDRIAVPGAVVKIGKELFTREGPPIVREFVARGQRVFLDLKFHDIPNTVAAACRAAADLGAWMINVHCSGGPTMLRAARASLADLTSRPLLIGVTVLTSLDAAELNTIGITDSPAVQVARLTHLARASGLDGVVCSPHEIAQVKLACGDEFVTVSPGIRPGDARQDDQQRTATAAFAARAGGDFIVVGRPITRATDPAAAYRALQAEMVGAIF